MSSKKRNYNSVGDTSDSEKDQDLSNKTPRNTVVDVKANLENFKSKFECQKVVAKNYALLASIPKDGADHVKYFRSQEHDIVVTNPYPGKASNCNWEGFEKIEPIYLERAISMTRKIQRNRATPLVAPKCDVPNVTYRMCLNIQTVYDKIEKDAEGSDASFRSNLEHFAAEGHPCIEILYNDEMVGFAMFSNFFSDDMELILLQIWKDYSKKGYGTAVVRDLEAMAFAQGLPSPNTHYTDTSKAFWTRVGWNTDHEHYAQGFVAENQSRAETVTELYRVLQKHNLETNNIL